MIRQPRRLILSAAFLALISTTPAFAVNKDMVQLEDEVRQLSDAVARLQQSHDKDLGLLTELVKQTADSVNKMSVTVGDLQRRVQTGSDAQGTKVEQVSSQIEALNNTLDETRARLDRIEKALSNIQSQQQSMGAAIQNLTPPAAPPAGTPTGALTPDNAPVGTPLASLTQPASTRPNPAVAAAANTPSAHDLYSVALGDFNSGNYAASTDGFSYLIKYYKGDDLAGYAYYYLGEIDSKAKRYDAAIKDYDMVLEQYPGNQKIPASQLHKGEVLMAMRKNAEAAREFQSLNQRYPNSPEAAQARTKLSALGIRAAR